MRFNFKRDANVTASPFDVNGTELNISMTSYYVDGGNSADISGSRLSTTNPASGKATFVYGRVIPRDVRVFGAVPYTANAWYEVFGSPNIGTTALPVSKNDTLWYTNRIHDDTTNGDANVTRIQGAATTAVNVSSVSANTGIENYNFAAAGAIPFSAKAHIDTDPWLWYAPNTSGYIDPSNANVDCLTHPCFNINVVPAVGATGSAKSTNESTKESKASTKGGTWKSTSDYAPAIR